jgi:hypothetical protein
LGSTEQVLPEDGDRIQSPKRCFEKKTGPYFKDKDKTMHNAQKHICAHHVSVVWGKKDHISKSENCISEQRFSATKAEVLTTQSCSNS